MEFNLADLFESVVDQVGAETAMVSGARRLAYLDLDRRANRLAHYFEGVSIGPGDHIGIQLVNGTEYIEVMLACFKIRAVPINVNYRYGSGDLEYLYRDAALAGLIFHSRFAGEVTGALGAMSETRGICSKFSTGATPRALLSTTRRHWSRPRPHGSFLRGDPTICTASTQVEQRGCPKGFSGATTTSSSPPWAAVTRCLSGDHIAAPGELAERVLCPGMTALAIPPFIHAAGHWLAFSTMFGGGKIVTLENGIFDPSEVWRLVEIESVNVIAVVGDVMARPLLDVIAAEPDRYDLSSLIAVGSGGALLSPSTKAELNRLLPGRVVADRFGSSETGQVGGEEPPGDPFGPPRLHVDDRTDVFDGDLNPIQPGSGAIGRLARGGHVPIGYLGDPSKSATTFVEARGQRWALPGDLASVLSDGTITVLGRGSLCINTGGEKVFPDEVEAALKGHADVWDVIVVGVPDKRYGEQVIALVQPRSGCRIDAGALRQFGRDRLTGYKAPKVIVVVDEIVRSPSGKPDYPWAQSVAASAGVDGRPSD